MTAAAPPAPSYTPVVGTRWEQQRGPHAGVVAEVLQVHPLKVVLRDVPHLAKGMSQKSRRRDGPITVKRDHFEASYAPYSARDKRVCAISTEQVVKRATLVEAIATVANGGVPAMSRLEALSEVVKAELTEAFSLPDEPSAVEPEPDPAPAAIADPAAEPHPPTKENDPMNSRRPTPAPTTPAALQGAALLDPAEAPKAVRRWRVRALVYQEIETVIEAPTLRAAIDQADALGDTVDVLSINQES